LGRHLDLGCGSVPRNPYGRSQVFGVDIREGLGDGIASANLSVQAIPYPDTYFESVSAYDFFEHIPRVVVDVAGLTSFFPFVRLMDEIWRVLEPNGLLYAITPAYPSYKAFVDPTHVNFISKKTHEYFVGDSPMARMYGFSGRFKVVRVQRVRPRLVYEPLQRTLKQKLGNWSDIISMKRSHLLWELSKMSYQD